jgi:hypothetical protein
MTSYGSPGLSDQRPHPESIAVNANENRIL